MGTLRGKREFFDQPDTRLFSAISGALAWETVSHKCGKTLSLNSAVSEGVSVRVFGLDLLLLVICIIQTYLYICVSCAMCFPLLFLGVQLG